MTQLPYSTDYIQVEETSFRAPVSERVQQNIGGAVNFLLDQNTANIAAINTINSRIASSKNITLISDYTVATVFSGSTPTAKVTIGTLDGSSDALATFNDGGSYMVGLFSNLTVFGATGRYSWVIHDTGVARAANRFPVVEYGYAPGVGTTADFGCRIKIFEFDAI